THFLVKLVFAAPASFFSAAWASQAAVASASHFFMKLVLAAPESFFALAVAAHPPPAAGALAAIAPLAAMSGAVLCDIANAEVDSARAAQRLSNCFMKI